MRAVAIFRLLWVSDDLPISYCRFSEKFLGFVVAKVVVSFTAKKNQIKNQTDCLLKKKGGGDGGGRLEGGVFGATRERNWECRYLIPFLSFTLFNWR